MVLPFYERFKRYFSILSKSSYPNFVGVQQLVIINISSKQTLLIINASVDTE